MSHRFLCNWITPKWPLRVPGTQLVNNNIWSLLTLVPIDSDRAEKVHKSCSVAHWKESHRFTLLKLPLKLAFIGKLTTSLNIENQSRSFSQRPTAGWRDFHQCSQCCFIANKMLLLKLLPVKQLQLIFNSCTNKNKRCKIIFVCSSGKGKCFPGKESAIVPRQHKSFRIHTSSGWRTCSLQTSYVLTEPKENSVW